MYRKPCPNHIYYKIYILNICSAPDLPWWLLPLISTDICNYLLIDLNWNCVIFLLMKFKWKWSSECTNRQIWYSVMGKKVYRNYKVMRQIRRKIYYVDKTLGKWAIWKATFGKIKPLTDQNKQLDNQWGIKHQLVKEVD